MARQLNLKIYGNYSNFVGDYPVSYLILQNVSSILLRDTTDKEYDQYINIRCDGKEWRLKPSKRIETVKFASFMDKFMKFDYRRWESSIVEKGDVVVSVDLNQVLDVSKFEIDF